jgi:hypothetical protein
MHTDDLSLKVFLGIQSTGWHNTDDYIKLIDSCLLHLIFISFNYTGRNYPTFHPLPVKLPVEI